MKKFVLIFVAAIVSAVVAIPVEKSEDFNIDPVRTVRGVPVPYGDNYVYPRPLDRYYGFRYAPANANANAHANANAYAASRNGYRQPGNYFWTRPVRAWYEPHPGFHFYGGPSIPHAGYHV